LPTGIAQFGQHYGVTEDLSEQGPLFFASRTNAPYSSTPFGHPLSSIISFNVLQRHGTSD
jgi:hypothetical protein